jgi:hypothetical protein
VSRRRLDTCAPPLQLLFNRVILTVDCTILEGHRPHARQAELFAKGLSEVRISKHNKLPSDATDAGPYPIPDKWGALPNPDDFESTAKFMTAQRTAAKELTRFYYFGGFVLATARMMGIGLRWGGDWDGDHHFNDQSFDDLVHFELKD